MLKDRLHCWLDRHQPVRHRVRTDAIIFRGECKFCAAAIYREAPRRWRHDRLATTGGLPGSKFRHSP